MDIWTLRYVNYAGQIGVHGGGSRGLAWEISPSGGNRLVDDPGRDIPCSKSRDCEVQA